MDPAGLTITEARRLIVAGELSPVQLLDAVHAAIERTDPQVGGYLSRDYARARSAAEEADPSLPLGGIPIAIKDAINVEGEPCTCASKILQGYLAPYDATVIRKLRDAGAVPFGRTNMDEFAMGSSTENSAIQITRNPHDPGRIPGGSSGPRGPGSARIRHRRLDPPTRRALRMRRAEAQLRTRLALRAGGVRLVARPDRTPHPHGPGRRARFAGHRRA
jgi:Asp-tRNA(Asn)/Glu-tRNA(Gln) amidotransferase A subunit family amidase